MDENNSTLESTTRQEVENEKDCNLENVKSTHNQSVTRNVSNSQRFKLKRQLSSLVISSMMLALTVAIKFIVELIPFLNFPMGGQISIVMVPLIITALYCGCGWGFFDAIAYSLINFFIDGVISWTTNSLAIFLTLLFDYFIPYGCIGFVGLFKKLFYQKKVWVPAVATISVSVVRLISHFFSGVIVWNQIWDGTGDMILDFTPAGVIYSLSYNAGYMIPTAIICTLVMMMLLKPMYIVMDLNVVQAIKPYNLDSESKFKLPKMLDLIPYYELIIYIIAILSAIPQIKCCGIGYVSMVSGLGLIAYQIYDLIKCVKQTKEKMMLRIIYLSITVIGFALSIVGITSMYGYGKDIYASK